MAISLECVKLTGKRRKDGFNSRHLLLVCGLLAGAVQQPGCSPDVYYQRSGFFLLLAISVVVEKVDRGHQFTFFQ